MAVSQPSADRLPPHSNESEMGVLGCCLIDPACVDDCQSRITDEAFYDLRHATIYKAVKALRDESKPITIISVQQKLKDGKMLDQIGGIPYLSELQDAVPSAANLPYYLDIVAEKHMLRKLIYTCSAVVGRVYDHSGNVSELLDKTEQDIMAIRPIKTADADCMVTTTNDAIADIEKMYQSQGKISGLSTGLATLDRKTDGLHGSELTVIAAYPGSGKTSLTMNIVEHQCVDCGLPVGVFSLEMSRKELVKGMIATRSKINLREVAYGHMTQQDFQNMTVATAAISKSKLVIDDTPGMSINQIRAKARRMVQRHKVKLFVVDYIQLASAPDAENRTNEIDAVSKGLKHMAKEFDVPVIALSQLNDDGKLKGARAIGEDADNVWVLQPDDSGNTDTVKLFIRKQRHGERNVTLEFDFIRQYTKFQDKPIVLDNDVPKQYKD